MVRVGFAALLALSLSAATGCATLTAPKSALFAVTSQPPGADVRVNGVVLAKTPANVQFDVRQPPMIEVLAAGYQPTFCPVTMRPGNGYVAADTLLCALLFPVGCVSFIDTDGSWNELVYPGCHINLQPGYLPGQAPPVPPPEQPASPQAPERQPAPEPPAPQQQQPPASGENPPPDPGAGPAPKGEESAVDRIFKEGKCSLSVERTSQRCTITGDLFWEADGIRHQDLIRPVELSCGETHAICDEVVACRCVGK